MVGFGAVVAASTLSGFAGIYFEKILKGKHYKHLLRVIEIVRFSHFYDNLYFVSGATPVSLWVRNVQLAVCAVPIALLTAYSKDTAVIQVGHHGLVLKK